MGRSECTATGRDDLADRNQSVEFAPDYAGVYLARADVHEHLRHYKKALADLDRALALRPDSAEATALRREVLELMSGRQQTSGPSTSGAA